MDWLAGLFVFLVLLLVDYRLNKIVQELRKINAAIAAARPPKRPDTPPR